MLGRSISPMRLLGSAFQNSYLFLRLETELAARALRLAVAERRFGSRVSRICKHFGCIAREGVAVLKNSGRDAEAAAARKKLGAGQGTKVVVFEKEKLERIELKRLRRMAEDRDGTTVFEMRASECGELCAGIDLAVCVPGRQAFDLIGLGVPVLLVATDAGESDRKKCIRAHRAMLAMTILKEEHADEALDLALTATVSGLLRRRSRCER